jgi:hypothetical protein
MSKLFGLCGRVHGTIGRHSDVAHYCFLIYCIVTTSMISCGLVWVVLVVGFVSVVTRG